MINLINITSDKKALCHFYGVRVIIAIYNDFVFMYPKLTHAPVLINLSLDSNKIDHSHKFFLKLYWLIFTCFARCNVT